jgi:DNA repair protein RadC
MQIKDMPWWNKPHVRLKKNGEDKLNPAELLSLILWSGKKGENAIDISNKLLKKYSFSKLASLSLTELEKEVGKLGAIKIKAMYEIFRKTNWVKRGGFKPTIESAQDVFNLFVDDLKDKKKEHFYVICIDTKNRIIEAPILVSRGTLNASLVHPREVFKEAIKRSANSIILVHNHPSGDSNPSDEDLSVTEKLKQVGSLVGIEVLDHVIVGEGYWSWKESNFCSI